MFPETALGKEPGIAGTKPQEGQTERKRIWNQRKGRNEENTEHRREGHEGIRTKAPGQRRRAEGTEKNVTKQRHRQKGTGKKAKEEDIGGWWQIKGTRTKTQEDVGKKRPQENAGKRTSEKGADKRGLTCKIKKTRLRKWSPEKLQQGNLPDEAAPGSYSPSPDCLNPLAVCLLPATDWSARYSSP